MLTLVEVRHVIHTKQHAALIAVTATDPLLRKRNETRQVGNLAD